MIVNKEILNYAEYIRKNFDDILSLSQKIEIEKRDIFQADKIENGYLQFMWEIMVEAVICSQEQYLEPYGDGADFDDTSSRVTYPRKNATKKIDVSVNGAMDLLSMKLVDRKNFDFIKLVSFDGDAYSQKSPFDFVLCDDNLGEKHLFSIKQVDFILMNGI